MRSWGVICIVFMLELVSVAQAETRRWTARTGTFSTEAELIDVKEGNVVLKKTDGTTVSVPLDRLSLADVRYVEQHLKDATAAVGRPVEETTPPKPANGSPTASAPAKKTDVDREPALTRANSSAWQVRADAASDAQLRDVSITLPEGFGSGDVLIPASASRFIGHVSNGLKTAVQAWDLRTGDRLGPIHFEGHLHPAPTLSSDGDLLAIVPGGRSKLQIWSLRKKSMLKEIDLGERGGHVQYLAFAGPRRLLLSGGFNQPLRVLDPRTGSEIAKIEGLMMGPSQPACLSPGGVYLAVGDSLGKPIRIFDTRNGELAGELRHENESGGYSSLGGLRFSADGQELAALYESPKSTLACWSMRTGKQMASHELSNRISGGGRGETPVDFIPGAKGWLVGGSAVVDREKGGPVWVAKNTPGGDATFLRMIDAERMLVIGGQFNNRQIKTERLPWSEISKSAEVVEKGGTTTDVGLPKITKAKTAGTPMLTLTAVNDDWKVPVEASPAGEMAGKSISLPSTAQVYEAPMLAAAGPRAVISCRSSERGSDGGSRIVYRRFNLKSGKEEGSVEPAFAVKALDITLDASHLLVASGNNQDRLDVFEFAGGKHVVGFRPYQDEDSYKARVNWAAMIDDERLLTLNTDGQLMLWSLPKCEAIYRGKLALAKTPILSPTRKFMIMPIEGIYQAIDTATGKTLGALKSPELDRLRIIGGHEFTPDGKKLAVVFHDTSRASLVCWDLTSGDVIHNLELDAGDDVTWLNDSRVLIHRPLLSDRDLRSGRLPPRRFDVFDLTTKRILWRYQLPNGRLSSEALGGLVWYVSSKELAQPAKLVGEKLPGKDTVATIASAPQPQDLLPSGSALTLDVNVSITGDGLADKVLKDDAQNKLTEALTKRGMKVQERSPLALRVSLRETLTGKLIELRPILGGVSYRYQIKGKLLTCRLELTDISRQSLWTHEQTIPVRDEIPRTGIPQGTTPDAFVRQQQWSDAMKWIGGDGLPEHIYEKWAYSGMGESILGPSGEALLSVDVPAK